MHESSNQNKTSSSDDGQGLVLDKAKEKAIKKMIQSKKQTDQRLIDMIRFKYARREGVKIGFGTFNFSGDEKMENDS